MADRNPPDHVFFWQIENFDEQTAARHGCICSPFSPSKRLDSTEWSLVLFPIDPLNPEYIALFLRRGTSDQGPTELHLDFEFCIIDQDGSERYNAMLEERFLRGTMVAPPIFIRRGALLDENEGFLLNNFLTLKCRVWRSWRKGIFPPTRSVIHTRIPIERLSFTWTIQDSRKTPSKRIIRVESDSVGNSFDLECEILEEDETINILHLSVRPKKPPEVRFQMSAKVTARSSPGQTLSQVESSYVFEPATRATWHLPNFNLDNTVRDSDSEDCNRVDLSFDFAISSGSSNSRIQESSTVPDAFDSEDFSLEGDLRSFYARMKSTSSDANRVFDLISCHEKSATNVVEVSTTDIILKTSEDDQKFFAHKMILSARSAVFRKILNDFDSQKKRWLQLTHGNAPISSCKITVTSGRITVRVTRFQDIVEISDMTPEILSQVLEFMYTDVVKPRSLKNAILLLKTSSHYQILALQSKMRDYLKSMFPFIGLQPEQIMDDSLEGDEIRKNAWKYVQDWYSTS